MNFSDFESVTPAIIDEAHEQIPYNIVNIALGFVCSLINVQLILIFLTYKPFRSKYQMPLILSVADLINCLGIAAMGIHRILLYNSILAASRVPIKTQWECAIEPWLALKGAGDLWPPIVQMLIGLERFIAVFTPMFYNKNYRNKSTWTLGLSVLFVLGSLLVGFGISWANRDVKQRFKCGRRAAFSVAYASFIYIINISGYAFGAILNGTAYCRLAFCSRLNENSGLLNRIRYALVISLLSTILVCLPNLLALGQAFIAFEVAEFITKPAIWAACINSGINFFVYFIINREFRIRCLQLIRNRRKQRITTSGTNL